MKTATLMGKKTSMDGVVQRRHYRLSEPIAPPWLVVRRRNDALRTVSR